MMSEKEIQSAIDGVMKLRPTKKDLSTPQPSKTKDELMEMKKRKDELEFSLELKRIMESE